MPTDIEKLASKRLNKLSNNGDVKPIELLRAAAADIESGFISADSCIIIFYSSVTPETNKDCFKLLKHVYRANVGWEIEIVVLNLCLKEIIGLQY